ncbi:hypothetical protein V6C42_13055 [Pseudoclostridium thermosuccinogenes]|uniref:hypothetical protein n=1 Tax=Clostridium thermosuccinogenes TaxID=84032 RepID=UPI002FD99245
MKVYKDQKVKIVRWGEPEKIEIHDVYDNEKGYRYVELEEGKIRVINNEHLKLDYQWVTKPIG